MTRAVQAEIDQATKAVATLRAAGWSDARIRERFSQRDDFADRAFETQARAERGIAIAAPRVRAHMLRLVA